MGRFYLGRLAHKKPLQFFSRCLFFFSFSYRLDRCLGGFYYLFRLWYISLWQGTGPKNHDKYKTYMHIKRERYEVLPPIAFALYPATSLAGAKLHFTFFRRHENWPLTPSVSLSLNFPASASEFELRNAKRKESKKKNDTESVIVSTCSDPVPRRSKEFGGVFESRTRITDEDETRICRKVAENKKGRGNGKKQVEHRGKVFSFFSKVCENEGLVLFFPYLEEAGRFPTSSVTITTTITTTTNIRARWVGTVTAGMPGGIYLLR